MTILAIDVGNSRVKLAICNSESRGLPSCDHQRALPVDDADRFLAALHETADLANQIVKSVIAGSNATRLETLVGDWPYTIPAPVVIRDFSQLPLTLNVNTPETVGIDRLLNAVGATCLYPESPTIVVDSGTATTIDVVANADFLGGAILPGLRLFSQALHDHTDALPKIDIEKLDLQSTATLGKDTTGAIAAGVLYGQVGAIREIVQRCRTQYADARLVLTGGAAERIAAAFPGAEVIPHLCLRAMASLA